MKIIAVEDDPILASALEMMLEKLSHTLIAVVDNSEDFLGIWRVADPDLALIDIKIEGKKNGIELVQIISQSNHPIPIIFITSLKSEDIFEEAKKTLPVAFMLKPFDELTLQRNIELAMYKYENHVWETPENLPRFTQKSTSHFFVKSGQRFVKVEPQDIRYITVSGKYSQVIIQKESYEVRKSLKELIQILPAHDFIRIHRNYIVNIQWITEIALKQNFLFIAGTKIPISQTYKTHLSQKLNLLQ